MSAAQAAGCHCCAGTRHCGACAGTGWVEQIEECNVCHGDGVCRTCKYDVEEQASAVQLLELGMRNLSAGLPPIVEPAVQAAFDAAVANAADPEAQDAAANQGRG